MEENTNFIQNKRCLITGATSGIGEVAARELADKGGRITILSRNKQKCEKVVTSINEEVGGEQVDYIVADLSIMAEVRKAADEFLTRHQNLDVLINNAGAYFTDRHETPDGFERTFALNHLSHFLLTDLLLDQLKSDGPARIINVASDAHKGSKIQFDDLNRKEKYSGFQVYGESKLANIMFTYALDRRVNAENLTVNAMHPGFVATGFGKNNSLPVRILLSFLQLFARKPEKGAETIIYLASAGELSGKSGKYYVDKKPKKSSSASYNKEAQEKLWQISQDMTGLG